MKNYLFLLLIFCFGCATKQNSLVSPKFQSQLLSNEKMSCRALLVDEDYIWLGMDKGRFGYYDKKKDTLLLKRIGFVSNSTEFRSIAMTKKAVFILTVGNPALLLKIDKKTKKETIVYKEEDDKVFYDSMQFADELNGFAMGDPMGNCLSFIKTTDGGNSWQKVPCENLPKVEDGEGAFATSNTNLIVRGKSIFMVSGGKKSRVFVSNDFGETWNVYNTPIIQGEEMTGIFTADFYDAKMGIIAGGNYLKQEQNSGNKAITINGGKSWDLIAEGQAFGYASCVQFVPNTNGKQLISVGGTGLFYSADFGKNWIKFSDDKDLFTFRFASKKIFYATGKNKLIRFEIK